MTYTIIHHAEQSERFAPDAFAGSIGKLISVKREGQPESQAVLVRAEVSADGTRVALTLDEPEPPLTGVGYPA